MNLCIIFILIEIHLLSAEDGLEFINNTNFSSDVNRWFIFAYLFRTLVLQLTTFILVVYLAYVTEKIKVDIISHIWHLIFLTLEKYYSIIRKSKLVFV